MAMAAGKSAGKPPRITERAFKPPTDAAIAMTGNERLAGEVVVSLPSTAGSIFFRRAGLDLVFMIPLATFPIVGKPLSHGLGSVVPG